MGEILAVFSAFFYGASNIYVNHGIIEDKLNRYEGLFVSLVVNNLFNLIILPFYLIYVDLPAYNFWGISFYVLAGILTSFLARVLLFSSIEKVKASRASVLKITAPVFTVILGVTVLNEKLNIFELFGILIVLGGVLIITLDSQKLANDKNSINSNIASKANIISKKTLKLGIVLGILAGLSLGAGNVFRKLGTDFYGSPFIGVVVGSIVSLLFVTIYSLLTNQLDIKKVLKKESFSYSYVIVGIWYSLATYSIFVALDLAPVSIVNSLSSTQPIFAIILSAFILKKHDLITSRLIVGGLVVIVGSFLIFFN
ncbi:DMT family transporter [Natranaerofaba carboxydovora]|uniref:DMT family transporter n=1 Tax=Natranaerofaba carboxydovora TaxID=2742683 RepID=UPI001F14789A|nr:DMT family transporter [Natranaerofaba carboxydovora]UMZ74171.1 EamA-like transporter family protein [Natranaerofaba carboxydovora]